MLENIFKKVGEVNAKPCRKNTKSAFFSLKAQNTFKRLHFFNHVDYRLRLVVRCIDENQTR